MFTEVGLENFKAFGKLQRIPLKPITLLYGPNSSGKSSFLQSLLLFKQTLEEEPNNKAALISRGSQVDLGAFTEFIHNHDERKELKTSFSFNFHWDEVLVSACENSMPSAQEEVITIEFTFIRENAGAVIVKAIRIFYQMDPEPFLVYQNPIFVPRLKRKMQKSAASYKDIEDLEKTLISLESINFNSSFIKGNWDFYVQVLDKNISENEPEKWNWLFGEDLFSLEISKISKSRKSKILKYLDKIKISFKEKSFPYLTEVGLPPTDRVISLSKCFPSKIAPEGYINFIGLGDFGVSFERENAYVDIIPIEFILYVSKLLSKYLNKIVYIGPLRDFPQRAYSFSGYLGTDVGKSGQYLPDILLKNNDLLVKANYWLERLDIGYEIIIEEFKRDLFTMTLIDKKSKTEVSPTDVGFGISQILPIIVQGVSPQYYEPGHKIICIEQPEIHLHPRLQAELGSFFADCIDKKPKDEQRSICEEDMAGNQFIIETHSENLILRLQRLIRKGELKKDHVGVIYFDKTPEGLRVKELRLNDKGEFIDPWPKGFFDESFTELFGD